MLIRGSGVSCVTRKVMQREGLLQHFINFIIRIFIRTLGAAQTIQYNRFKIILIQYFKKTKEKKEHTKTVKHRKTK